MQITMNRVYIAGALLYLGMVRALAQAPTSPVATSPTPVTTSPTPVTTSPVTVTSAAKVEAESVEIHDLAAYPPAITRSAGPFILQLVNKTRGAPPNLEWVAAAGPTAQSATLTAAVNLKAFATLQRQLSLVNPPSGQYFLQSTSGKVFLTLTIR